MSEPKHTPGPWHVKYSASGISQLCSETMILADLPTWGEMDCANARLITAAPDFYNACVIAKECLEEVLSFSQNAQLVLEIKATLEHLDDALSRVRSAA